MNDNSQINSEQDADHLLDSINQPAPDLMEQPPAVEPAQADPTPQQVQEYEFQHNGKVVKAPVDKILKWASQGYDAPNKIGELNKQVEEWKTKEAILKEMESKYGEVDQFVRKNPEWFDYVQKQYQQQLQQKNSDPLYETVNSLKSEIDNLKQYKDQVEQERLQANIKQEDEVYMKQLGQIKEKYPTVDFDSIDPATGKNLEYKVLEFAQSEGIKNFETAFKSFYHDELVKIAAESAKEKLAKDKIANSKLGILGISSTPITRGGNDSVRGKSYKDLELEALRELGIQ